MDHVSTLFIQQRCAYFSCFTLSMNAYFTWTHPNSVYSIKLVVLVQLNFITCALNYLASFYL